VYTQDLDAGGLKGGRDMRRGAKYGSRLVTHRLKMAVSGFRSDNGLLRNPVTEGLPTIHELVSFVITRAFSLSDQWQRVLLRDCGLNQPEWCPRSGWPTHQGCWRYSRRRI